MKIVEPALRSSELDAAETEIGSKLLNTASYLGAISGIIAGYSSAYLVTAVEVIDRQMGQNQISDRMATYTGITSLVVGGMSSALLNQLNKRRNNT